MDIHNERVAKAQAKVDSSEPTYMHTNLGRTNPKRLEAQAEAQYEIDKVSLGRSVVVALPASCWYSIIKQGKAHMCAGTRLPCAALRALLDTMCIRYADKRGAGE